MWKPMVRTLMRGTDNGGKHGALEAKAKARPLAPICRWCVWARQCAQVLRQHLDQLAHKGKCWRK